MTATPTLGPGVAIDVQRLIESRLLIQANSGSGKSWAIRRLLEQTYGACQHIVIDVEGEFHTLREKFDYILAGQRGDCPATTQSAALLARRLLELGASAIVDIYELGVQRQRFVRLFLDALVNAPRELWHPALIVVDEAHLHCPEAGHAESAAAVIDLMTRGRKRGFAGVLATQRIAKLHKDAAAEANNKLIGRSTLDIDMKRAAAELGFTARDDMQRLRKLPAGEFYAFGPALAEDVTIVKVGAVATTHPKAGQRAATPTPPRAKVREVLAQLADLPAEAEAEAHTAAELRAKVAELEKRLAARAAPAVETKVIERRVLSDAELGRLDKVVAATEAAIERLDDVSTQLGAALTDAKAAIHLAHQLPPRDGATEVSVVRGREAGRSRRVHPSKHAAVVYDHDQGARRDPGDPRLTGPERRILEALAWMESIGHREPRIEAVAFLADYSPGGGAFNNTRGALRSKGLIDYPTPGPRRGATPGSARLGRAAARDGPCAARWRRTQAARTADRRVPRSADRGPGRSAVRLRGRRWRLQQHAWPAAHARPRRLPTARHGARRGPAVPGVTMTDRIDLDELARKARAATPGTWTAATPSKDADGWPLGVVVAAVAPGQRIYTDHRGGIAIEANRQHIAANSPPVTLALIARIRELETGADRAVTIADEAFGLGPVERLDDTLSRIERGINAQHRRVLELEAWLRRAIDRAAGGPASAGIRAHANRRDPRERHGADVMRALTLAQPWCGES